MPRDLFGDVTRPSVSIGNRTWCTVPVSLLSHSVVVAAVIVLPLIAAPLMPGVLDGAMPTFVVRHDPPPPPPAVRPPHPSTPAPADAAPLEAPDGVTKEPEVLSDPVGASSIGIVGGADDLDRVLAPPPAPTLPPPPQKPVQVGGNIRRPMKVSGDDPVYPQMARAAGVQGLVIIEATIGVDGRIVNARVLRGLPLLDQAALAAVRSWEYTPTMLNGVPVPVIMTVTLTFTLSR